MGVKGHMLRQDVVGHNRQGPKASHMSHDHMGHFYSMEDEYGDGQNPHYASIGIISQQVEQG
jgi:hypothetical protein